MQCQRNTARALLLSALAFAALTVPATAYRVPNDDTMYAVVSSAQINNDPQVQAEALKVLGLFQGTDAGFELSRGLSRAEAAALLTRFLGAESEALSGEWAHPFDDVPVWADGYVGWLYQNGLTKGVSETAYGAAQGVTGEQYATFLSRALSGGDDFLAAGVLTETEKGNLQGVTLLRQDALAMSVRALTLPRVEGQTLARYLCDKGVFDTDTFYQALWDVLPPAFDYDADGHVVLSLAGVPVRTSEETGLRIDAGMESDFGATQPYLFAYRATEDALEIWRLDCKTLAAERLAVRPLPEGVTGTLDCYVARMGEKDYLLEQFQRDGENVTGALLCYDGSALSELLTREQVGESASLYGTHIDKPEEGGVSSVLPTFFGLASTDGTLYHVSAEGIQEVASLGGAELVFQDAAFLVTQEVTDDSIAVRCLDASGAAVDEYSIPYSGDTPPVLSADRSPYFYGEAGLFLYGTHNGFGTADRFTRLYDKPVRAIQFCRWGAGMSDPFLLLGDGAVVRLDAAGVEWTLLQAGTLDSVTGMDSLDSVLLVHGTHGKRELTLRPSDGIQLDIWEGISENGVPLEGATLEQALQEEKEYFRSQGYTVE